MMGISVSMYSISKNDFKKVEAKPTDFSKIFNASTQGEVVTFEKNYFGLEYLLLKHVVKESSDIVSYIWIGNHHTGEPLKKDPPSFEWFEKTKHYHKPQEVKAIYEILKMISLEDILLSYNADELNEAGIYPRTWHNDESENMAFNKSDIRNAFLDLLHFYKNAATNSHYVVVFSG